YCGLCGVLAACAPAGEALETSSAARLAVGKADAPDAEPDAADAAADGDAETPDVDAGADTAPTDAAADTGGDADAVPPVTPYPDGPFGTRVGHVLADHEFLQADGSTLSFEEIRSDPSVKVILWVQSAEWCSACIGQVRSLNALHAEHADEGLYIIESLIQDRYYSAPDASTAQRWMRHGTQFTVVADLDPAMFPAATPSNYIIDAETMLLDAMYEGDDPAVDVAVAAALSASSR